MHAVQDSITDVPATVGAFSTFLLAGNNLGLLGEPDQAKEIVNRLAEIATPPARLIGSGLDPYATDWFDYSFYRLDELAEIVSGTPWTLHSAHHDAASYRVRLDLR